MTDYEKIVIKALKKYIKQAKEKHYEYIAEDLQDALDIINRLKAKEEKNENIIRLAEKTIEKQQAEIERLKDNGELTKIKEVCSYQKVEIQRLNFVISRRYTQKELNERIIFYKNKARKEFWEKLKQKKYGGAYPYVLITEGDNLLKEMESESDV